jgi:hypothetical protein
MTESVIGAVILKTVLFTYMQNIFRLLKIIGNDMNIKSTAIHFHFKRRKKKSCKMCRT